MMQRNTQHVPAHPPPQQSYLITPPTPNRPRQQRPLPVNILSSQIQEIMGRFKAQLKERTQEAEDPNSINMLILHENGEERLITVKLPQQGSLIKDILKEANVSFTAETNIQVTAANTNGINYIVTVGNVSNIAYATSEEQSQAAPPEPPQPSTSRQMPQPQNSKVPIVISSEEEDETNSVKSIQSDGSFYQPHPGTLKPDERKAGHRTPHCCCDKQLEKPRRPVVVEDHEIRSLKNRSNPVTSQDINQIANYIGHDWRDVGRALAYEEPEMDQFEYAHPRNLKEIVYSMLRRWMEMHGPHEATVGVLAQKLWESKQEIAVKKWAEKYEALHE